MTRYETLFPYTKLFRSEIEQAARDGCNQPDPIGGENLHDRVVRHRPSSPRPGSAAPRLRKGNTRVAEKEPCRRASARSGMTHRRDTRSGGKHGRPVRRFPGIAFRQKKLNNFN